MEYELCAGNWARAWELASAIGADDIAEPLLWLLERRQNGQHFVRVVTDIRSVRARFSDRNPEQPE